MIKITGEVAKWQAADSTTIPALHYIAVTAQEHLEEIICTACACRSNKSIFKWAKPIDALVF
jgi:hypothetical protein